MRSMSCSAWSIQGSGKRAAGEQDAGFSRERVARIEGKK
jgi:hypothetical protein